MLSCTSSFCPPDFDFSSPSGISGVGKCFPSSSFSASASILAPSPLFSEAEATTLAPPPRSRPSPFTTTTSKVFLPLATSSGPHSGCCSEEIFLPSFSLFASLTAATTTPFDPPPPTLGSLPSHKGGSVPTAVPGAVLSALRTCGPSLLRLWLALDPAGRCL